MIKPPTLEALIDERDTLRIRISLNEDQFGFAQEVSDMRRRLLEVDKAIIKHRAAPNA